MDALTQHHSSHLTTMTNQNDNDITKAEVEEAAPDNQSDLGVGKMLNVEYDILIAQGHRPVLKRTFDFFGSIGLGFRSGLSTVYKASQTPS